MADPVAAVRAHLGALLTTADRSVREAANTWLAVTFQESQEAWETSLALVSQPTSAYPQPGDVLTPTDLQLFDLGQ